VPGVDLGLHFGADSQQAAVLSAADIDRFGEALPEAGRGDAGAGQGAVFDKAGEAGIHLQSVAIQTFHGRLLTFGMRWHTIPKGEAGLQPGDGEDCRDFPNISFRSGREIG
jgi:hypothetical protein